MTASAVWTAPVSPAWPSEPPTIPGVWSIDVLSEVPIGDPLHRAAAMAAGLTAVTAALNARLLVRLGFGPVMSAGVALAVGVLSYGSLAVATHLPASLAAALAAAAVLVSEAHGRAPFVRASAAGVLQAAAALFQPAAIAALPLLVTHARGGTMIARALSGLLGIIVAGWWGGTPAPLADAGGVDLLNRPWLWPFAAIMIGGALAPLRGRHAAGTALVGTAVMVSMIEAGRQASALAVFPTLLLADGLTSLPDLDRRARIALVAGLTAVALAEAWRVPAPAPWPLVAWRDAVERAVPAGTDIETANPAAAALDGPLFEGRASRIGIVGPARPGGATRAGPRYVLEDLAATAAAQARLTPVPVTYASVADFVARLPAGTIAGIAVAGSEPEVEPRAVRDVLAQLGHQDPPAARAVAAAGIVGKAPAAGLVRADGRLHVLIGDPLGVEGQRSPTDFELRAGAEGVSVRLRGRVLATGRRWAVIALRPGGPLIDAMADAGGSPHWPIGLPGLQLYVERP